MRAVSEVRALIGWLEPQASSIAVAGLSLGSEVAALVSHLDARVDAVTLYTPILGLNMMIGMHLGRWGSAGQQSAGDLQSATVAAMTSVIDPLRTRPFAERRLIVAPGMTKWLCAVWPWPCTSSGAGSSTGTTAAMSGTCSPVRCRMRPSGS